MVASRGNEEPLAKEGPHAVGCSTGREPHRPASSPDADGFGTLADYTRLPGVSQGH
jgi:hypothetical protein